MKILKPSKKPVSLPTKIVLIVLCTILVCFYLILFFDFLHSKELEEQAQQSQIEQEERQRQKQLEEQARQEEKARQEKERLEKMKESLPTKFNMRDKIKITAENQGQKPLCSTYAYTKSIEITLNYQGNYDYDFEKVYKYLKTAPNDLQIRKDFDPSNILKDLIGLDNCTYEYWSLSSKDLTLIKNELVNGRPMLIDINNKMAIDIGGDPNYLGTKYGDGHEMIIIGYDDTKQSWLVLNSWGANWGKNGNGTLWVKYDNENTSYYQYGAMLQAVIKE